MSSLSHVVNINNKHGCCSLQVEPTPAVTLSLCIHREKTWKAGGKKKKKVLPEIPVGYLRRSGCVKHFFLHKHLEIKLS